MHHLTKFGSDQLNHFWNMAMLRFFKMAIFRLSKIAAAAILDFQILEILTVGTLNRAKLPHLAKFL